MLVGKTVVSILAHPLFWMAILVAGAMSGISYAIITKVPLSTDPLDVRTCNTPLELRRLVMKTKSEGKTSDVITYQIKLGVTGCGAPPDSYIDADAQFGLYELASEYMRLYPNTTKVAFVRDCMFDAAWYARSRDAMDDTATFYLGLVNGIGGIILIATLVGLGSSVYKELRDEFTGIITSKSPKMPKDEEELTPLTATTKTQT